MRRHSRNSADSPERQQEFLAYLADAHTSDEEMGVITLVLLGHAIIYLLLTATEVTWIAVTAARVWRRREHGLLKAVRPGVDVPALAALLTANVGDSVLRRAILARLNRRIALRSRQP
jgi:hypothetical protein